MRSGVLQHVIGSFLQVYGALILLPVPIALYYSESYLYVIGFLVGSITSILIGTVLKLKGELSGPSVNEAMFSTVLGWILAIILGAIPLTPDLLLYDAIFESAAGLTTTGISVIATPENLPNSVLFWRSFMQWIGGLGILTFFIAVIRESGGASRRLFSAETHKTDSGSIRPSLMKSITALWKVYGFVTAIIIGTFIAFGVSVFESLLHGFSTISTGGFSTRAASIGAFNSTGLEAATVLFMFIGGVNFVLLYRFLRTETEPLYQSSEFRMYTGIFLVVSMMMALEIFVKQGVSVESVVTAAFHSAAVISSTGYSTMSFMAFSVVLQLLIVAVMFVGGSLGSTAGGIKVFRLKTMMELLKVKIRSYSLPETAINEVKIDGEIMDKSTVRTISALVFAWIIVVFFSTIITIGIEDVSLMGALSGSVSAASNMGPVFIEGEGASAFTPFTKVVWSIVMVMGRLEMLPALAIFNRELFQDLQ